MKKLVTFVAKWVWFGVLVLVAFGYLASGLSDPNQQVLTSPTQLSDAIVSRVTEAGLVPNSYADVKPEDGVASADQTQVAEEATLSSPSQRRSGPVPVAEVQRNVNLARRQTLETLDLRSADTADWLTVCRRLSLSLTGSGLSLEEIRKLQSRPEVERESVHLTNLLNDPRFHDYWGERWTRYLVGADEGPFIVYRRRRFRHWLSTTLKENRPYDEVVRALVTAEGLWTDKPQVNFLTVTFDSNDGNPDPIRLAARTSRAFLGLRIDCLQCHNDFLGNVNLGDPMAPREGLQTDFHGLAAFYSTAKTNGLQGVKTGDANYKYKFLDETEETDVIPSVPFSEELLPEEGDQRSRLASWITHKDNRQFARAAVVRFWTLMFGKPPTESVDNLPLDEPLPDLLEPIIDDFANTRDIRRVIEIIARSDAFRVESRADFEISTRHEDNFAVFPLTRLRAEQVAGSIAQAARIKSINRQSSLLVQLMRFGSINDFLKRYGDKGENELSDEGITIPQRLMLLNGEMLRDAGQPNPVLNTTSHINMFASDDAKAVETAFLCLLNRFPHEAEQEHFTDRLAQSDKREKAIEDLFWVLANSSEFVWNH